MKSLTIYDIKRLSNDHAPHFFERKTLKFFGQTMKSFRVYPMKDGTYMISAPMHIDGLFRGYTAFIFDPKTGRLESES